MLPLIVATRDSALEAQVLASYSLSGVTGGSALVAVGNRLLAVHDDAFRATWIELPSLHEVPLILSGLGTRLDKAVKPDFECGVHAPGGCIYLLGSGASSNRQFVARIDPNAGSIDVAQRPDIYGCLKEVLGADVMPNVEGAIVDRKHLVLFHRGIGMPSVQVRLPSAVLGDGAARVLRADAYELGTLGGVHLGFTDAAPLAGGRIAFVATAEDTPNAIADGPVAGSAVGVLEKQRARWTVLLGEDGQPFPAKVEGLALAPGGAWILTDADAPDRPALLARVRLNFS